MFSSNWHDQSILEISQGDYIAITAESFLIDRQAGELSKKSLKFYKQFLKFFIQYCDANSLKQMREVTPDFLRRYLLVFHSPRAGPRCGCRCGPTWDRRCASGI